MSNKEDFMSLWGKKAGANPQASVIGGLQKQIGERDKEIEKLNQQLTTIKARLAEDVKILEESEKTLNLQAIQIQDLKNQVYGKGKAPPDKPDVIAALPPDLASAVLENKQLKGKVNELQEKIYVFSMLPDRITDLEKKNEKLTRMIDQYEVNEKKLTETVKKLSIGAGAEDIVLNLQDKVKTQDEKIKQLEAQLDTAKEQAMFPVETATSTDVDTRQLKQNLANLTSELKQAKLTSEEERNRRIELEAKVDILKKTLESTKQSGSHDAKKGNLQAEISAKTSLVAELETKIRKIEGDTAEQAKLFLSVQEKNRTAEKENKTLRDKVTSVEEKYKDATLRFENLVAAKTKGEGGFSLEAEMRTLRSKVDALSSEKQSLASEKRDLELQVKELSGKKGPGESVSQFHDKLIRQNKELAGDIEKYKSENAALKADLEKVKSAGKEVSAKKGSLEEQVKAVIAQKGPEVSDSDFQEKLIRQNKELSRDMERILAENDSLKAQLYAINNPDKGGSAKKGSLEEQVKTAMTQKVPEASASDFQNKLIRQNRELAGEIDRLKLQISALKTGAGTSKSPVTDTDPGLQGLVTDLQTKLNQQKLEITKLKRENEDLSSHKDAGEKIEELEKQLTELKGAGKGNAGGEETSNGPLSSLVSDLQAKLSSTKTSLNMREAEVKKLENKLRDYATKERMIEDKLAMADSKLASATRKDLEASQKGEEFAVLQKKCEENEAMVSQLNGQIRDLTEQLAKAQGLVKDRNAELKELEDKVQNLRDALARK